MNRKTDALWSLALLSVPFIVGFATYALHASLLIALAALAVCLTARHMEMQKPRMNAELEKGKRNDETDSFAHSDFTAVGIHGRGAESNQGMGRMEPAHGTRIAAAKTRRFVVCGRRHTPRSIRQTL